MSLYADLISFEYIYLGLEQLDHNSDFIFSFLRNLIWFSTAVVLIYIPTDTV